jgi:hypothetical protein
MSKLKLTFDEYIKNPAGKGSSINPSRDTMAQFYQTKYDALVARDGLIKYEVYRTSNDTYYIVFHIPSNSTKGFTYETVVEMRYNSEAASKSDIKKYLVRFYSNDPDFNFTHAHAYYTHGMIIPEFERKLTLQVKTMKANTRNPDNAMGYVQSIYFAYITMVKNDLFNKVAIDAKANVGGVNRFYKNVSSYTEKEKERVKFKEEQKKLEQKSSNTKPELKPKITPSRFLGNGLSHVPIVSKITHSTKSSSSIKSSKNSKTTKRR